MPKEGQYLVAVSEFGGRSRELSLDVTGRRVLEMTLEAGAIRPVRVEVSRD
jgi:hypothetical protein